MEIDTMTSGNVVVIAPADKTVTIDAANADDFLASTRQASKGNHNIVLDMRSIEFLDSSGLSALIALSRSLRKDNGELRLSGVQPRVMTVFEITRFYRAVEIYERLEEAIKSYREDSEWF